MYGGRIDLADVRALLSSGNPVVQSQVNPKGHCILSLSLIKTFLGANRIDYTFEASFSKC